MIKIIYSELNRVMCWVYETTRNLLELMQRNAKFYLKSTEMKRNDCGYHSNNEAFSASSKLTPMQIIYANFK